MMIQKLLKSKTKVDKSKEFEHRAEKHDHENISKSLIVDNDYDQKKYKSLNEKKLIMIVSEFLIGLFGLDVGSGLTLLGLVPVGVMCVSSFSFLSSISALMTKECFSKLKIRYTKLWDWINVVSLLYGKILKQSMVDREIDEKWAVELKKICNHYLDKGKDIIKQTQLKVGDIFGDIEKDNISQGRKIKLKLFETKMMWI